MIILHPRQHRIHCRRYGYRVVRTHRLLRCEVQGQLQVSLRGRQEGLGSTPPARLLTDDALDAVVVHLFGRKVGNRSHGIGAHGNLCVGVECVVGAVLKRPVSGGSVLFPCQRGSGSRKSRLGQFGGLRRNGHGKVDGVCTAVLSHAGERVSVAAHAKDSLGRRTLRGEGGCIVLAFGQCIGIYVCQTVIYRNSLTREIVGIAFADTADNGISHVEVHRRNLGNQLAIATYVTWRGDGCCSVDEECFALSYGHCFKTVAEAPGTARGIDEIGHFGIIDNHAAAITG